MPAMVLKQVAVVTAARTKRAQMTLPTAYRVEETKEKPWRLVISQKVESIEGEQFGVAQGPPPYDKGDVMKMMSWASSQIKNREQPMFSPKVPPGGEGKIIK